MSNQPVIVGFHTRRAFLKGLLFAVALVSLRALTARLKRRRIGSDTDTGDKGHYVYALHIPLVARPLLVHNDFSAWEGLSGDEIFRDTPMGVLLNEETT